MAKIFIKSKERSQDDEFWHRIQQLKMQELWDNKEEEEAWKDL